MRFTYQYRTSDNAVHTGEIVARDKQDAYAKLKAEGIRPGRVDEAPGFFNFVFGKGKRWLAIGLLSVALLAAVGVVLFGGDSQVERILESQMRRQVVGDLVIVDMGIRTGWSRVFSYDGERFLASFAVPGVPAGLRSTSAEEVEAALSRRIEIEKDDGLEARQIKAMVEGMKTEARNYLKAGGTIAGYGSRLVERQEAEIAIYAAACKEIEEANKCGTDRVKLEKQWELCNQKLRRAGIRLVAFPHVKKNENTPLSP